MDGGGGWMGRGMDGEEDDGWRMMDGGGDDGWGGR